MTPNQENTKRGLLKNSQFIAVICSVISYVLLRHNSFLHIGTRYDWNRTLLKVLSALNGISSLLIILVGTALAALALLSAIKLLKKQDKYAIVYLAITVFVAGLAIVTLISFLLNSANNFSYYGNYGA